MSQIYEKRPEDWHKKMGFDTSLEQLEQELKNSEAYKQLLQVFDENYVNYVKSSSEDKQNPKLIDQLAGRFPHLMEIVIENITFIETALKRENNVAAFMKEALPTESVTFTEATYRYGEDFFEIDDGELEIKIHASLAPEDKYEEIDEQQKTKLVQYYSKGMLHGPSILFAASGQLLTESFYYLGKKTGRMRTFYLDGALHSLQRYKNGLQEGLQYYFYSDGKVKSKIGFEKGLIHGPVILNYPNGHLKRELYFERGKRHGVESIYSEMGGLSIEAEYMEGKPSGVAKMWHENGQLAKEVVFSTPGVVASVRRWNKVGAPIAEEAAQRDYFDEVTRESGNLTHALGQVVANLEGTAKVLTMNDQKSEEIMQAMQQIKNKLKALQELNEKLQEHSGMEPGAPEPVWKSPSSKKMIQQYIDLMTSVMQESMIKIVSDLKRIQKKVREEEDKQKE